MATTSLQDEVKGMIESFVAECRETKPSWDIQRQIIGERICQLARRVEEEKTKLETMSIDHVEDNEEIAQATKRSKHDPTAADAEYTDIQQNIPKPTNLLELVEYILSVVTDEQLEKTRVGVFPQDNRKFYFESRQDIQELLDKISVDDIDYVNLGTSRYSNEHLLEAYGKTRMMFVPETAIAHEISSTALRLASKYKELPWDETLVVPMNEADLDLVKLVADPSTGIALVVSGESGSGKTWFAQNYIPHKLGKQDLALIYHSLDSYDGYKRIEEDPQVKEYTMACHSTMCSLMDVGLGSGEVYDCVSNLSMQYTCDRDAHAYRWLREAIADFLKYDKSARNWWNESGSPPLEKLVIVIDEVGKNPELACSLITIARQFYEDIIVTNKKAKQVLLVLVGSGSDWYVRNHHLPYAGDDGTRTLYSTSGTDPQKSNIIVMKGPNLLPKTEIAGIPTSDILKGTYSSTFATNTRMLTRGILPVLTNSNFKDNSSTDSGNSGYADLGSTNVAMDHAARIYIQLGGLSHFRDRPALLNKMLLKQFRLLLWERQFSIKESNPAAAKILEDLKLVGVDFHQALSLGIVTSDIKSTSPALRYLACNGFSAPNYAKDGIELDILLQHHLVRLCEAYHSCQDTTDKDPDKDANKYWAGQYTLKGEWPPTSSKEDMQLRTPKSTRNDVEKMYQALVERQLERDKPNGYEEDIDSIINLVKKHKEFDLVMRQQPYCGQGARFIILKKTRGIYSLDLFHSSNEMPGINSMQFKKALQCLGVKLEENHDHDTFNITPDSGLAGYTYYGTTVLAKKLSEKLKATVAIGQRTLILPKGWDGEPADVEFLQKAMEKGLMVWTPEMLEPTISTFKSK